MRTMTTTELARNLSKILDRLAVDREEIVLERNNRRVARILAVPAQMTALEVMADLYRTMSPAAAEGWVGEARAALQDQSVEEEGRDPWAT
jgi:antitoxin (DNA-binding transcriptional repressor) of toxin-antitoxin stability system